MRNKRFRLEKQTNKHTYAQTRTPFFLKKINPPLCENAFCGSFLIHNTLSDPCLNFAFTFILPSISTMRRSFSGNERALHMQLKLLNDLCETQASY
jgi:hypothetical protein